MPWSVDHLPRYRKHRASGQAIVTLKGRDYYLGPHGTAASRIEYDRLIAEWLQNGRQLLTAADEGLAVVEVIARYAKHARSYYRKGGKQTSEFASIQSALRILRQLYGHQPVAEFGPLALQTVRQKMVEKGHARGVVNQHIGRIKRMFKWAAAEEIIPASIPHALFMVAGLRLGRTAARETDPVEPVEDSIVDATLPHLPDVVADMVRLHRLTGMRPAEVCIVRPCDVSRQGKVWTYRPESHKTEHHGRSRTIFIGPKAQAVLLRYLARDAKAYCFRPCESEAKRRAAAHEARKTPLSCGNRPGSNRSRKPKRPAGEAYTTDTYRRAIHRGCVRAFPHPQLAGIRMSKLTDAQRVELDAWQAEKRWAPNQLRHTAATEIRREFGLEAAQVVLGHSKADVTQVYAERDAAKGRDVALRIG